MLPTPTTALNLGNEMSKSSTWFDRDLGRAFFYIFKKKPKKDEGSPQNHEIRQDVA